MDVITDTAETVELTWPALGAEVPSHLRVVLEDLATGRRMSMRHRGSYVFEADQAAGASRAFAISIEPNEARPQFVDVRVQPGRGGSTTVTYTVSGAATVDVLVQGPGGRTVRHVARGRAVSQGTHSESWDGRDEQGRPVPNGTYRIVLLGSNELGEQVRETRVISYRR